MGKEKRRGKRRGCGEREEEDLLQSCFLRTFSNLTAEGSCGRKKSRNIGLDQRKASSSHRFELMLNFLCRVAEVEIGPYGDEADVCPDEYFHFKEMLEPSFSISKEKRTPAEPPFYTPDR